MLCIQLNGMCLNPGDIVNRQYQIIRQLGRGGFGVTYLARDNHQPENADAVVLKQIPIPQLEASGESRNADYLSRLELEANTLWKLKHPCIPGFLARFTEGKYFYIVQEYIAGQDLSQEIVAGEPIEEDQAVVMLREILLILRFVHNNKIIHRDIKPANIIRRDEDDSLVLIDFGAVKEEATGHTNTSGIYLTQAICTPGYAPAEQLSGMPKFESDIYAVGMMIMQAVTGFSMQAINSSGRSPRRDPNNQCRYDWQSYATNISSGLRKIIAKMIEYHFRDRYQSVAEVLDALNNLEPNPNPSPDPVPSPGSTRIITDDNSIESPSRFKFNLNIAIGTSSILAILAIAAYYQSINLLSLFNPACTPKTGDHLSCGEEILYAASKSNERTKANQAVIAGNYDLALNYYQSSWQKDGRDAETLIYMNNALLEVSNADYYTLAVAAPLSYKQGTVAKNYELGEYILRGVAQAQTAVNLSLLESQPELKYNIPGQGFLEPKQISNQKPKGLKIVISDDRNSEDDSKKMAPTIAAKPKILGLMGHYASNVTLGAVDIYEKTQLAEVSFGTTTIDLSDNNPRSNFFRVVYSSSEEAQAIGDALTKLAIKNKKVAIFFNPESDFSNNLRFKLEEVIKSQKLDISLKFNIADEQNFSTSLALEEAKNQGVNIFILIPDGQETNALARTIELIEADNGNTMILGANPLAYSKIKQIKTDRPLQLISAAFWHPLVDPEGEFTQDNLKLWRTEINGNTATAYDATLALIEAIKLQNNPTRKDVLQQLQTPGFTFDGATGQDIKFNTPENGDRLDFYPTLVRLVNCGNSSSFVLLSIDNSGASNLACQSE
jgi:serine/threonine protein kinase/ABC-type branched-subunit amino acid transport system substrate-binding protein